MSWPPVAATQSNVPNGADVPVTVFSFVGTFIIAKVIGFVMKTRVTEEDELTGLDVSIHGESAYEFGPLGGSGFLPQPASTKESVGT